jgi:hypothetical protein
LQFLWAGWSCQHSFWFYWRYVIPPHRLLIWGKIFAKKIAVSLVWANTAPQRAKEKDARLVLLVTVVTVAAATSAEEKIAAKRQNATLA